MTVGELVARMDSWEWSCWQALAGLDPFGEDRADWRSAHLASTVGNFAGKVASREIAIKDCLLKFEPPAARGAALDRRAELALRVQAGFARVMAAQRAGTQPTTRPE